MEIPAVEESKKKYDLRISDAVLLFTTGSFRAEKSSVLHAGVYSKEFSSMLCASALSIITIITFSYTYESISPLHIFLTTLVFIIVFLGSRKYVFRDSTLQLILDKNSQMARFVRTGLLHRHKEEIPFEKIKSIEVGIKKFIPENRDGVEFVQKISLQHGSAIPGLGNIEEFVTLSMKLTDGSEKVFFACRADEEPELPLHSIEKFLGFPPTTHA